MQYFCIVMREFKLFASALFQCLFLYSIAYVFQLYTLQCYITFIFFSIATNLSVWE